MICNKYMFLLIVISSLLLQNALGDLYSPLSPMLSPLLNGICDIVECGKGKCEAAATHSFGFVCNCNPGWTQFHIGGHFRFLPCIIPNCTINYSCSKNLSMPLSPTMAPPTNLSLFDPCMWAYCGGGKCITTGTYEHKCICNKDFSNLFNASSFPCYRDCSLGADCENLGISILNSTASPPGPEDLSGSGLLAGKVSGWILALVFCLIML